MDLELEFIPSELACFSASMTMIEQVLFILTNKII